MELTLAQELIKKLIKTGEVHPDYETVTRLAEKLAILITGKGISKLLRQVASRETEAAFAQRVMLTRAITPAVAASIKKPFYKVARNQRIKKSIEIKNDGKLEQVEKMISSFYGSQRRKNRGLDHWLNTRFMELTFTDPNAWVVAEWSGINGPMDIIAARPFEVSSNEAVNFKIVNDEVRWLLVKQDITYFKQEGTEAKPVPGLRFTLYDEDFTVVMEHVDPAWLTASGYAMRAGQELIVDPETNQAWLSEWYKPNIGFVPAIRIGYNRDLSTKGRTFVNPFEDAMCFFDKSIKTVSEFDLSMTLHTFPQKIQYMEACKGESKSKKCNAGYNADGSTCGSCKGTGYATHTSAQDVMYVKMPEDKSQMMDLEKFIAYKSPPIELIKFQNEYTQQLKAESHQAVFNSQVFIRKSGSGTSGATGGAPTETATENDNNMQSVYDTLEPFTEHYSEVYKDFVTILCILAGERVEDITIEHEFPSDFKLKTSDIIMSELRAANESGAPSFLRDALNFDLAEITFQGDKLGLVKYRVKRRYFPFGGKNEDEISLLLSSQYVPLRAKVLYCNFETIFSELEIENPGFYLMLNVSKQSELVEDKITDYIEAIAEQQAALTPDSFRQAIQAPGNAGGDNGGDPNPGTDNQDSQNSETVDPVD